MNIIIIMSGGVGNRFGADIPKQYCRLNGRPVIDYVIDAAKGSKAADKVLVVADPSCVHLSQELQNSGFDFAVNGKERLDSLKSAFDYIQANYPDCDGIIILDAVAPFVTAELIDDYLLKLRDYDAVITCQKITGALGNYDFDPLDREQYYMTQSPEAFRFKTLMPYFTTDFPSQELAWQMPRETKKYLNFDFKNNLKLTYDFQLREAEYILKNTD
ncbi:MAG: 2-C-methyl-D-erythritol 4-phosphate cytidylyltransferase [Clostridiales bacterium]|nr:2-C-methyl-D-erythritol 4-phosphate cytidylyltransferase [Clostridiales bacterium]MCD7827506.1 2-C-methyl-D-erythritol 4-phosphate cytidylyltransferase [Clostridiales bacterium]